MKRLLISIVFLLLIIITNGQSLKPYIGGNLATKDFKAAVALIEETLKEVGLEVVGSYQPANEANRMVWVYTSTDLRDAVSMKKGLRGFALSQRVGLTKENNQLIFSSTNPIYWGAAYFQDDYSSVNSLYESVYQKIENTFSTLKVDPEWYGSEKGIDIGDLKEYQYMFGMPYFDDVEELGAFDSFSKAVEQIQFKVKESSTLHLVGKVVQENDDLALFSIGISGEDGEGYFLPIIDISNPKHTCFLPYELLVSGEQVYMLQGRYRIALSFPDLTMSTFTKIMSTPGDIEDALRQVVE